MKEFLPGTQTFLPGFLDIFYHCLPLSENPTPQLTIVLSIDTCDSFHIQNFVS